MWTLGNRTYRLSPERLHLNLWDPCWHLDSLSLLWHCVCFLSVQKEVVWELLKDSRGSGWYLTCLPTVDRGLDSSPLPGPFSQVGPQEDLWRLNLLKKPLRARQPPHLCSCTDFGSTPWVRVLSAKMAFSSSVFSHKSECSWGKLPLTLEPYSSGSLQIFTFINNSRLRKYTCK